MVDHNEEAAMKTKFNGFVTQKKQLRPNEENQQLLMHQ